MKLISATTIATTVVLLQNTIGLVAAIDLRFYPAPNCSGAALMLTSVSGVSSFTGWGSQTCSGPVALTASSTGCKPAAFAAYSGRYRSNLSTAQPTSSRIVARAPADCIEPDSFGFVDENGKEHLSKISAGNRRAVYAALGKGDVATLKHNESEYRDHYSSPSLVIKAEGPSFQLPPTTAGSRTGDIGFSNISTCIEIPVESDELSVSEQLLRVAVYASQIGDSGAQYTPLLNIHTNPHTFVRLILGLSSPNEADIGLDTSIEWRVENGRKVSGVLKTRGADDAEVEYPLHGIDPFFRRSELTGRCTTCWRVSDPTSGEDLVVKDSWRSHDRTPESTYLRDALGIAGVTQMISYEADRGQTADLRGSMNGACFSDFENRVETRIVIRGCGDSITTFTSAKVLLCALRDAIAGHMALFKRGILHRDVSIRNILKGKLGAEQGDRGVLIDLDMAIHLVMNGINPLTDCRIGTALYQSVMVLSSCDAPGPLLHDHLDDLESFLYVFTHILYLYDQHGVFHSIAHPLNLWEGQEGSEAAWLKLGFLAVTCVPHAIASRWPDACIRVFEGFHAFLAPIAREKMQATFQTQANPRDLLKRLQSNAEEHYNHILQLFDDGIAALEEEEAADAAGKCATPPPNTTSFSPSAVRNPLKRASEDDPDALPPAKRSNSAKVVLNPRSPNATTRSNLRSA
ncbi:hypothetical protein MD484_g6309, partial [Candolleomyces efflorescens]